MAVQATNEVRVIMRIVPEVTRQEWSGFDHNLPAGSPSMRWEIGQGGEASKTICPATLPIASDRPEEYGRKVRAQAVSSQETRIASEVAGTFPFHSR